MIDAAKRDSAGERVSLFAAGDGRRCRVCFAPGYASWEKELGTRHITTTAFIPADTDARVFIIEGAAGLRLNWAVKPVMGAADAKGVHLEARGGVFPCRIKSCNKR